VARAKTQKGRNISTYHTLFKGIMVIVNKVVIGRLASNGRKFSGLERYIRKKNPNQEVLPD